MKKTTVNKVQLQSILESVSSGLASKELIEQSDCFVFHNGNVTTFNDNIFTSAKIDFDFDGVLKAEPLMKLLNKIKDKEISIWTENEEFRIKGKKFETGLKFNSEIRLPIDEVDFPKKYNDVPDHFSSLLKLAALSAGRSLSSSLLTCVHIDDDRIESCDNDRITISYTRDSLGVSALIPANNILDISKSKIIGMSVDDSWAHFKTDKDVLLSTILYNDEYPDLQQFVPLERDAEGITLPDELKEILDRADVFSQTNKESKEKTVSVSLSKGKLKISAMNEFGWIKEPVKTDYSGPDLKFTMNVAFLRDILNLTDQIAVLDDMLKFQNDETIHLVLLEAGE